MTHYATGTRFEHKCRDDLEANGYDVIRAAGSKGSTKVDLAAFKPGQLLLIQAKANGALSPDEWNRVLEVAGWVGAVPILAANGIRGRGITYIRLRGPKRPGLHMKNQACEVFHLDQIAASSAPVEAVQPLPEGSVCAGPREGLSVGHDLTRAELVSAHAELRMLRAAQHWTVARDADKPCQACDRTIRRGEAYAYLGAELYEHIHCPEASSR